MLCAVLSLALVLSSGAVAQEVWGTNPIPIVNPWDYGATANCGGGIDEGPRLLAAVAALPATGGIVWMNPGMCVRKDNWLTISKAHVKLWCESQDCTIYGVTGGALGKQSINFTGGQAGVFGVKFTSDASSRYFTAESNTLTFHHISGPNEVVGAEIARSSGVGVFLWGGTDHFVEGNYIHHTYADHIHFTEGANGGAAWSNFVFNEAPTNGDDGIASVTYNVGTAKVTHLEWWNNTILHTGGGRGLSCVGGNDIYMHDNVIYGTYAAGIVLASEPSYNTETCTNIVLARNKVYGTAQVVTSHTGILISGQNPAAAPIGPVVLTDNHSYGASAGAYRSEGAVTGITQTGLVSAEPVGGTPPPPAVSKTNTRTLRTRDTSFVAAGVRTGLYRIHVRRPDSCVGGVSCFQSRYEYVVKGAPGVVAAWAAHMAGAGGYVSYRATVAGVAYALVLVSAPVPVPAGITAVSFWEMRAPALSVLWDRVDTGSY